MKRNAVCGLACGAALVSMVGCLHDEPPSAERERSAPTRLAPDTPGDRPSATTDVVEPKPVGRYDHLVQTGRLAATPVPKQDTLSLTCDESGDAQTEVIFKAEFSPAIVERVRLQRQNLLRQKGAQ